MKTLGIIPARFASTRFPGKPLALLGGKPLIQWVWERAQSANSLDALAVATDEEEIARAVRAFGGQALLTRCDHLSGTDRCGEALSQLGADEFEWVLNIQGDEPFVDPAAIDQAVAMLKSPLAPDIVTLARPIRDAEALHNPNVVKVALAQNDRALYFSRWPLPFFRGLEKDRWLHEFPYLQHIGLYGFRSSVLMKLSSLLPSPLEMAESLEQLRWLENGYSIAVAVGEYESLGVDTPEDLARAERELQR